MAGAGSSRCLTGVARPFRAVRLVRGGHILNEDLSTPGDIGSYKKFVCFFFYAALLG